MQIDHDPHEIKPQAGGWLLPWAVVAVGWAGCLYFNMIDWTSVALGAGTGGLLATWAIELTGNRIPDSWRKPPKR